MSKRFLGLILALGVIGILIIFLQLRSPKAPVVFGIIQTASHPALDAARKGFEEGLKRRFGTVVDFNVKNAQSSVGQAHLIAQNFFEDKSIVAVYAIGAVAAQAASQIKSKKPLFVAAVTNPFDLELDKPEHNACGSYDMPQISANVRLIRQLFPKAKVITIFYNKVEVGARKTAKLLLEQLEQVHLEVKEITFTKDSDIPLILNQVLETSDVIVTPVDNTVALSISLIADKAKKARKPLIVSDNFLVKEGALASAGGVDYYHSGNIAAQCATAWLAGMHKPHKIGFKPAKLGKIIINRKTLDELELKLPLEVTLNVEFV